MEAAKCRSCKASIIWARSARTGTLMPLDADPDPSGNIALMDGMAHVVTGDMIEEMLAPARYVSHFSTCPSAEKWRKKRS